MNLVAKGNHALKKIFSDSADTFFARTVDDIFARNFFDSFDANIIEQQDAYRLEIVVPGLTREDLTIDVDGRVMSVSTRRKVENHSWRTMEFSKHLQRSFLLPVDADANNIKAKCRHGLLAIRIGKIKRRDVHRIIHVTGEQSGSTVQERITSWWMRLHNNASRLLNKERRQGR